MFLVNHSKADSTVPSVPWRSTQFQTFISAHWPEKSLPILLFLTEGCWCSLGKLEADLPAILPRLSCDYWLMWSEKRITASFWKNPEGHSFGCSKKARVSFNHTWLHHPIAALLKSQFLDILNDTPLLHDLHMTTFCFTELVLVQLSCMYAWQEHIKNRAGRFPTKFQMCKDKQFCSPCSRDVHATNRSCHVLFRCHWLRMPCTRSQVKMCWLHSTCGAIWELYVRSRGFNDAGPYEIPQFGCRYPDARAQRKWRICMSGQSYLHVVYLGMVRAAVGSLYYIIIMDRLTYGRLVSAQHSLAKCRAHTSCNPALPPIRMYLCLGSFAQSNSAASVCISEHNKLSSLPWWWSYLV